jgi:transposase InsO family protein
MQQCQPTAPADDTAIVEAIAAICDEFESYGYRRVSAALRQAGMVVNHKKIRRLMREHDLQPRMRRRFVATTDSNHEGRSSRTGRLIEWWTAPISSGWRTSPRYCWRIPCWLFSKRRIA